MTIVQSINSVSQFRDAFRKMDRQGNFSYKGLDVLFDYLEEYSDATGEPVELDVIALCCEYSEDSVEDIIANYRVDVSEADGDEDEIKEIVREHLNDNTIVCGETEDGFVYAVF